MAATNAWNESSPTGSDLASSIDDFMRAMKLDIRERLAVDHVFGVDQTNDGRHTNIRCRPAANVTLFTNEVAASTTGANTTGLVDLAITLNTSGAVHVVNWDITNTASHANSTAFRIRVGGSSILSLSLAGVLTATSLVVTGNTSVVALAATGLVTITNIADAASGIAMTAVTTGRPVLEFKNATTGSLSALLATNTKNLQLYTNGQSTLCATFFSGGGMSVGDSTDPNTGGLRWTGQMQAPPGTVALDVSGTTNDLTLPNATVVYLTGTTGSISGMTGGSAGRVVILVNNTGTPVSFTNEDAGSTAANRFNTGSTTRLMEAAAVFVYDGSISRWRSSRLV